LLFEQCPAEEPIGADMARMLLQDKVAMSGSFRKPIIVQ
jgi:hypothetical protein